MIDLNTCDTVFLSYDEPNADQNWQQLLTQRPHSLRVHGVKGSNAAHRACAAVSDSPWIIIVDGDNRVHADFWQHDPNHSLLAAHSVLSYRAQNTVNALTYGNGGLKIWPRAVLENLETHEAVGGQGAAGVDFCWQLDYVLMPRVGSSSVINTTAQQAWRAGFREGVKMALIDGQPYMAADWLHRLSKINRRRLETWLMVGLDQPLGQWAILGSRQGLCWAMLDQGSISDLQDFDCLEQLWLEKGQQSMNDMTLLGQRIHSELGLAVTAEPFSPEQSMWAKFWLDYKQPTEPRRLRA